MLMLALTLLVPDDADQAHEQRQAVLDEGFLGRFALWAWSRGTAAVRFQRAPGNEDRKLQKPEIGRGDLSSLTQRHPRSGG
jgi:hypothetical protein